jgi:CHAT domain-containing protein
LIADWAAAVAAGAGSAELDRLRVMADAMRTVTGDALYQDSVAAIDRAQSRGSIALKELAAAHHDYAAAAEEFMQDRFAAAAPRLAAAKARLEAAGSPFAHRVAIDIAGTALIRSDYAGTLAAIARAKTSSQSHGYSFLEARSTWFEGLVAFAEGHLGETQAYYEDTLSVFERMGDAEQAATAHNLLASLYYYLGDRRQEWQHRQQALMGLSISRSERLRSNLLATAGLSLRTDNPEAALMLHGEALASARASGRGMIALQILTQRAATLLSLGRLAEAEADLEEARRELSQVREPGLGEVYELLVLGPQGDLERRRDPQRAVATANRALEIIRARNNPADRSRLPAFHLQLAQANIVWGNRVEQAKIALADGIRAFEAERALLADEGSLSTLDQSWQLFEVAVQLAIEDKDYAKAFAMAERARVRTITEARQATAPPALPDVQGRLTDRDAIVALNQFNDDLAVWVIRRDSVAVTRRPLTRGEALRLVARQQDEIGMELPGQGAGILFNEILRPVAHQLNGASRIIFIPDSTFENLSFAGLWDSSRRRFLVEDRTLAVAPSVGSYLRALSREDVSNGTTLILGGPSATAGDDARAVASVYPAPSVLTGTAATRNRFLSEAPSHSIIHVAATTATNQAFPLLSRMMLADEAGQRHSGAVLGRDIAARPLSQTNLVVIDEVETNATDRGEGTLSLARAFLSAGVPAVLGTLPGANEHATRDLVIGFHREMAKNVSAEQALSTVQRNAIQQNGRRLGAWTALVIYGSDR